MFSCGSILTAELEQDREDTTEDFIESPSFSTSLFLDASSFCAKLHWSLLSLPIGCNALPWLSCSSSELSLSFSSGLVSTAFARYTFSAYWLFNPTTSYYCYNPESSGAGRKVEVSERVQINLSKSHSLIESVLICKWKNMSLFYMRSAVGANGFVPLRKSKYVKFGHWPYPSFADENIWLIGNFSVTPHVGRCLVRQWFWFLLAWKADSFLFTLSVVVNFLTLFVTITLATNWWADYYQYPRMLIITISLLFRNKTFHDWQCLNSPSYDDTRGHGKLRLSRWN